MPASGRSAKLTALGAQRTPICKYFCFCRKGEAARFYNMCAPNSSRGEENSDGQRHSRGPWGCPKHHGKKFYNRHRRLRCARFRYCKQVQASRTYCRREKTEHRAAGKAADVGFSLKLKQKLSSLLRDFARRVK